MEKDSENKAETFYTMSQNETSESHSASKKSFVTVRKIRTCLWVLLFVSYEFLLILPLVCLDLPNGFFKPEFLQCLAILSKDDLGLLLGYISVIMGLVSFVLWVISYWLSKDFEKTSRIANAETQEKLNRLLSRYFLNDPQSTIH
ncbi:MAG: hypothetical protein QM523_09240 [Candidatus Pacebacteria bacterium]|nr:hypothetical protein [Candidatus Paceibacterota bacterium]